MTAALTSLSMAYALSMVLGNALLALFAGLLGGAMIFNLDRVLLISTGQLSWPVRALSVAPRLMISALLAGVISGPLTVGLFRGEIDAFTRNDRVRLIQQLDERLSANRVEILTLERQLADAESRLNAAFHSYVDEMNGTSSGLSGVGPISALKLKRYEAAQSELESLRPMLAKQIQTKKVDAAALGTRRSELLARSESPDFLGRLAVLKTLADREPTIRAAVAAITLLLFFIQCAPVLTKLLAPTDVYGKLMRMEADAARTSIPQLTTPAQRLNEATQQAFSDALDQSELNPKNISV